MQNESTLHFLQMPIKFAYKLPDEVDKPSLAMTKPEFRKLRQTAIMDALNSMDDNHPVFVEMERLVKDYAVMLRYYWDNNGNTLPSQIKVSTMHPIEKIAMELACKGMSMKLASKRKPTIH